jgi:hypothetical protein
MASAESTIAAEPATQDKKSASNIPKGKKELKILMLHGTLNQNKTSWKDACLFPVKQT